MHWKERLESSNLTGGDIPILSDFIQNEITNKNSSAQTLYSISDRLICVCSILHECGVSDLTRATTDQFMRTMAIIRERYPTANTQRTHINVLKRLCKYLVDDKKAKINCQRIQSVKLSPVNWRSKTSDDLLNPEELERVIESAETPRDKAIVTMMADGCFRPIEIRTMRWDQLTFDEYGCRVKIAEKTQYEREFRFTYSLPFLLRWRENYPDGKPEGRKPVFVNERRDGKGHYTPMSEDSVKRMIYDIRDRTGIKKLKPSIFRPTGLTNEAEAGTDHTYLCMKGWGNMSTSMVRTYVKPTREYMDRVALQKMGKPVPEGKKIYRTDRIQEMLKPKVCPNEKCKSIIPATASFCPSCGVPLTEEAKKAIERDKQTIRELMEEILKEKEREKANPHISI